MESFKTIQQQNTSLFKDKGSKHLGFSFKVSSVDQVKEIVGNLRKEHPKCNHVCFAYRVVSNDSIQEYATDDGEPSNSAGGPILGQIKSKGFYNVLVCVVRYFGGTKLGVSGLINAYKNAAAMVLTNSGTTIYTTNYEVVISVDSKNIGQVLSFLSKEKIDVLNQSYSSQHEITVHTSTLELDRIKTKFENIVQLAWEKF